MANLIIKPTSGGSLILQDEGGTAAHTIDASGNHTLSGTTNNIGTVTAGTYNATIGSSAVMPAGIMRHLYFAEYNTSLSANPQMFSQQVTITASSKIKLEVHHGYEDNQSSDTAYSSLYFTGDTNSGLGATSSGELAVSAMDYKQTFQNRNSVSAAFIVNPTITNPTYGVYWGINSGSPVHSDVNSYFVITEIYQ